MSDVYHTIEVWKPVVGWEGLFSVSDAGRVMRLFSTRRRRAGSLCTVNAYQQRTTPVWYSNVHLWVPGKPAVSYKVHRVVAAAFIGDPTGLDVNHLNGDGTDNRACNLELCSHAENIRYSVRVLGRRFGGGWKRGVLNESLVRQIRQLLADGVRVCHIQKRLGVSKANVHNIKHKNGWAHVTI